MTNEITIQKLKEMRLSAMADAFSQQLSDPQLLNLTFEERLSLLVDTEYLSRKNNKVYRLIRNATFDQSHASIADINYSNARNLNKSMIHQLATCKFIEANNNVIIMGASGAGKSYLACAIGMEACKHHFTVRYIRMPELLLELAIARGEGIYQKYLKQLRKLKLLIIDDWMLHNLNEMESRDLLEIIHARHKRASTIFCSQFTPEGWHARMPEAPLADAILDRIVHDSYTVRIDSTKNDKSMREIYGINF
jgi:DNA replication protein DnaC